MLTIFVLFMSDKLILLLILYMNYFYSSSRMKTNFN